MFLSNFLESSISRVSRLPTHSDVLLIVLSGCILSDFNHQPVATSVYKTSQMAFHSAASMDAA